MQWIKFIFYIIRDCPEILGHFLRPEKTVTASHHKRDFWRVSLHQARNTIVSWSLWQNSFRTEPTVVVDCFELHFSGMEVEVDSPTGCGFKRGANHVPSQPCRL